jgi:restriction system protein
MKNYYQVRLGRGGVHADECQAGQFIGVDYDIHQDLTGQFPDVWRDFNKKYIPVFLENRPDKSKIAAGLACGALWVIGKGITIGDTIICPTPNSTYLVGQVTGDYHYVADGVLQHRRPVQWLDVEIQRTDMSDTLRGSTGSMVTVSNITKHAEEIEKLLDGIVVAELIASDEAVEDASLFAMESHLEHFLIQNWAQSELGKDYDIFEIDGEQVGQQYQTDTGPLDILAISKDHKTILVVELKKGRASDKVVGQILRYMGYVQDVLAEDGQQVRGVIIALEDDNKLRRALAMVSSVDFYRYQISFKLIKA